MDYMKNLLGPRGASKNLIVLAIAIIGILVIASVAYTNGFFENNQNQNENENENVLSTNEISEKAINFINENVLQGQTTASLIEIVEESGLYKVKIKIGEEEFDSYISKDGKLLFPQVINMEEQKTTKSDRPDVKLFVMSYCPYGLQSQKMFLPVYDLLKNKADIGIYFVDYIMHDKPEIDENLRQYCIQKEDKEQYYNYLKCFVQDGDFEKCLSQANIDKAKIDACVLETDNQYKITEQYNDQATWVNGKYPKFDIQAGLNEEYEVQGSPTVIINDELVSVSPRSPEKFKQVVCEAFNEIPEECSQTLSEEALSPGFGGGTSSSSGGECK